MAETTERPEAKDNSLKRKAIRKTAMLLTKTVIFAVAVFIILQYVFGFYYHRGNYMFPMVKDGDAVITFKLEPIVTNDVVVYEIVTNDGEKEARIGRVVAQEGDVIDFTSDGEFLLNGSIPAEEIFYASMPAEDGDIEYPYTVPEGTMFILNDYRSGTDESFDDSRRYGAIPEEKIHGKVWVQLRRRGF